MANRHEQRPEPTHDELVRGMAKYIVGVSTIAFSAIEVAQSEYLAAGAGAFLGSWILNRLAKRNPEQSNDPGH